MNDMKVKVDVISNVRQFINGFSKAETKVTGFGKRVSGVMRDTTARISRFGKKFRGVGGFLGGVGLVAGITAAGKKVIDFDERLARLAMQANIGKKQMLELKDELYAVGKATHQAPEDLLEGIWEIVEQTGRFDEARKALKDIGIAATATGSDMRDMGEIAANFLDKDVKPEGIFELLDMLAAQGEEGAFTLANIATNANRLAAAAGRVNIKGKEGWSVFGAWIQEARKASGTADQATTAIEGAIAEILSKRKEIYKLTKFDILDVAASRAARKEVYKPLDAILKGIISGTDGSQMKLGKIFGRESIRAMLRMAEIYDKTDGFGEFERFKAMGGSGETIMKDFAFYSDIVAAELKDMGIEWKKFIDNTMTPYIKEFGKELKTINEMADAGIPEGFRSFAKREFEPESPYWLFGLSHWLRKQMPGHKTETPIIVNNEIYIDQHGRTYSKTDNMNTQINTNLNTGRLVD